MRSRRRRPRGRSGRGRGPRSPERRCRSSGAKLRRGRPPEHLLLPLSWSRRQRGTSLLVRSLVQRRRWGPRTPRGRRVRHGRSFRGATSPTLPSAEPRDFLILRSPNRHCLAMPRTKELRRRGERPHTRCPPWPRGTRRIIKSRGRRRSTSTRERRRGGRGRKRGRGRGSRRRKEVL